ASKMGNIGKGLRMAGMASRAAGLPGLGASLSGAGMAAGRVAALAGGPVGMAIAGVVTLGMVGFEAAQSIRKMSAEALEAQKRFASASGAMAAVFAEKEVQDMIREMKRGNEQAESARILSRSSSGLEDRVSPWERRYDEAMNLTLAHLAKQVDK